MNRLVIIAATVSVASLTARPPAAAFNAEGHKVVAAIAWQKLSLLRRAEIVAVLRQHPRFDEDFANAIPIELAGAETEAQNRWIFCQAAVWPDIARGLPDDERDKYHRPRWHYINLPVFWDAHQAQAAVGTIEANLSFEYPSSLTADELNAVQAIKRSIAIVNSSTSSVEKKAVHYCWLIHVIADLHQPLHSAALFSKRLFPGGDRGGNLIEVREGNSSDVRNLHSVWDGLLGNDNDFTGVLKRAAGAVDDFPADFNATFVGLPHDAWSTECQQVAMASVYRALLTEIAAAESAHENLEPITLEADYLTAAARVSRRQAVMAGARLAGVLESVNDAGDRRFVSEGRELGFPVAIAGLPSTNQDAAGNRQRSAATGSEARLESLETEIHALRLEVVKLRLAIAGGRSAAAGAAKDDGEQCTCGAEEPVDTE